MIPVTFLKIALASLAITWKAGHTAAVFNVPSGLVLDINDLGGEFYRTLTSIAVPMASVKILLTSLSEKHHWLEAADIACDANLDIYSSPVNWHQKEKDQAQFVEEQDRQTQRAKRFLAALRSKDEYASSKFTENLHSKLIDCFIVKKLRHFHQLYLHQPLLSTPHEYTQNLGLRSQQPSPPKAQTFSATSSPSTSDDEGAPRHPEPSSLCVCSRCQHMIPDFCSRPPRRISPLATRSDRNADFSSGDESDNDDLSDEMSESEWSDTGQVRYNEGSPR
jgi:hypothetical protein